MIPKYFLEKLYLNDKRSVAQIAKQLNCSQGRIDYWLDVHEIKKRSISDAQYINHNPQGDPFLLTDRKDVETAFLQGLGLGLYWGEGNKKNTHAVRLGNTDPRLIRTFLAYLKEIWNIDEKKLRFGLQIFSDMNPESALNFWAKELGVPKSTFQKVIVTKSGKVGTYREKTKHGVVTLYFHNKKLRDLICDAIEKIEILG